MEDFIKNYLREKGVEFKDTGDEQLVLKTCIYCFTENTPVVTSEGIKPIHQIRIGDYVLTHRGRFKRVISTMSRWAEDVIDFDFQGNLRKSIGVTTNHEFYGGIIGSTKRRGADDYWVRCENKYRKFYSSIEYGGKSIKDMDENFYLEVGAINSVTDNYTKEDLWIFGLFLAEGHLTDRSICFSLHEKEVGYIEKIKNYFGKASIYKKDSKAVQVLIHDKKRAEEFRKLFKDKKCDEKVIPYALIREKNISHLLEGLCDGDAYYREDGLIIYTTTSESLAYQVQLLANRLNYEVSGTFEEPKNKKKVYRIFFRKPIDRGFLRVKSKGNGYCLRTGMFWKWKTMSKPRCDLVFNITVEDDHSYVIGNIAVKNCGDDKFHHFYMGKESGLWDCKKCGLSGHFNKYRQAFGDAEIDLSKFEGSVATKVKKEYMPLNHKLPMTYASRLFSLDTRFLDYLKNVRKLDEEIIKKFRLGSNGKEITIPIYENGVLVNIRYRRDPEKDKADGPKYSGEKGCKSALFNGDKLKEPLKACYITEGEFDAMMLIQKGIANTVSVTLGASYFSDEWAEKFTDIQTVYICFDTDEAGRSGAKKVAEKIGFDKCKIIHLPNKAGRSKTDLSNYFIDDNYTKTDFLELVKNAKGVSMLADDTVKHIADFNDKIREVLIEGEHLGELTGYDALDDVMGGLRKGRLIIVSGLTNCGKCISKDMEIVNPISGAVCNIEGFVKQKKKYIFSWEYDHIKRSKVVDWIDSGMKEVFKVKTIWGTECEVTSCHPFLRDDLKWIELKNLKVGDKIGIPTNYNIYKCGVKKLEEYKVKTLAYLIAEGGCTKSSFVFTNYDEDLVKDFKESVENFENIKLVQNKGRGEYRISSRKYKNLKGGRGDTNSVYKYWLKSGLKIGKSDTKFIPKCIFTLKEDLIAKFISVLFSCDGHIGRRKMGWDLSYSSNSKKLIYQLRHLLLRFGVDSRIRKKITNFKTIVYELHVVGGESVQNFKDKIGFVCKRKQKILDEFKNTGKNMRFQKSALRFVEITEIENLGKKQVYDLEVEGTHNFIANDMLVHNTSWALNIALNLSVRGLSTFFFSLEMPPIDIVKKVIMLKAKLTNKQLKEIEDPSATLDEVDKTLASFKGDGTNPPLPMYLYNGSGGVKFEILAECARLVKEEYNCECIFVDHLHYFVQNYNNLTADTSKIVRQIKQLAMDLDIPIVLLTHLNRGGRAKSRTGLYIPSLSDLRDTGALEQDADQVLFVCRDSENDEKEEREKSVIKLAKNRDGYAGRTISMIFDEEITTFVEVSDGVEFDVEAKKETEALDSEVDIGELPF